MLLSMTAFGYIAYAEQSNFKAMGTHKIKNIMALALCSFSLLVFILIHNIISEEGQFLSLMGSGLFWMVMAIDAPVVLIKRKNYQYNHGSITSISGGMQLSFVFLPLSAFIVSDLLGYKSPVPSIFNGTKELLLYSIGIGVLLYFYLKHKIQLNKVRSLTFLLLTPAWMSLSLYAFITLMQTESLVAPFIVISAFHCIMFFIMAARNGEFAIAESHHLRDLGSEVVKMIPAKPIMLWLGATVSAELFVLGKRLSQLLSGVFMDYYDNGEVKESLGDFIFVVSVILYTFWWVF